LFSQTIVANQTQALNAMLTEHTKAVATSIAQQLQQQREWEMEVMKKEHENSTKLMQMMMNSFHHSMQMLSTPTATFYPRQRKCLCHLKMWKDSVVMQGTKAWKVHQMNTTLEDNFFKLIHLI
jgi:hypothetical protein